MGCHDFAARERAEQDERCPRCGLLTSESVSADDCPPTRHGRPVSPEVPTAPDAPAPGTDEGAACEHESGNFGDGEHWRCDACGAHLCEPGTCAAPAPGLARQALLDAADALERLRDESATGLYDTDPVTWLRARAASLAGEDGQENQK